MRKIKIKKNIFVTFLISYLIMLLLPFLVGIFSYFNSMKVIKKEMESYNIAMLQQAQKVLDERLHSVEQLAFDVALNPIIHNFLYIENLENLSEYYSMNKVVMEMSKYKNANDFLEGIYLYYKNTDTIMLNTAKYTPEFFYNEEIVNDTLGYIEWKDMLQTYHFNQYQPETRLGIGKNEKNVITYLHSLPLGERRNPLGTLVISIAKEKFENVLSEINILDKGTVYIVDSSGKIIIKMGNENLVIPIPDHVQASESFYTYIDKQEVVASSVPSKYLNWRYISVIPTSVFSDNIKSIRNITLIIFSIEIILGVILAVLLAKRNYSPIKNMFEKILEKLKIDEDELASKGQMNYIEEITISTIMENESIKDTLQKYQPVISKSVINQLIKGNANYLTNIGNLDKNLKMNFSSDYFCVMLVSIDDCSRFVKDNSIEEKALISLVITNVMEEIAKKKLNCIMVDLDINTLALVANIKEESKFSQDQIFEIAEQSNRIILDSFYTFTSMGIGRFHKGTVGIYESYKEAEKALGYKIIKGMNSIIIFQETGDTLPKYCYPIETEVFLVNSVKSGEIEKVYEILDKIFKDSFINEDQSLELIQCLFFDISSTAIKLLNDLNIRYEDVFGTKYNVAERLINCQTIQQMNDTLKAVYQNICTYIGQQKKSHNLQLKERILAYINDNFDSSNLSLTSVAEELGINPAYLSYYFKEQIGNNFSVYISKLRIEKVKQLLRESNLSIQEIAEKVGYNNSAALISNFKKQEGMTPGKYRECL